jgi:hypothetical protein
MTSNDFLISNDGQLRFTRQGLKNLSPYFEKAGIDIRSIRTEVEYLEALATAAPYHVDWEAQITKSWPDTEDYRLLRDALFRDDSPKAFQEKLKRQARKHLAVIKPCP